MELSYGLVNLMYFMLCGELSRIKGSRSNKRRKLLTCFTNSLFKVYNNLSLRETGPEVYNNTALECKRLSHNINGVDNEKWKSVGYELCFDGIREKFMQNPPLLAMLKTMAPKTLAEATMDRLWGTGIRLRDRSALDTEKWSGVGWLSRMLITIRDEQS